MVINLPPMPVLKDFMDLRGVADTVAFDKALDAWRFIAYQLAEAARKQLPQMPAGKDYAGSADLAMALQKWEAVCLEIVSGKPAPKPGHSLGDPLRRTP